MPIEPLRDLSSDTAAREAALHSPDSVLVRAPAGSGKTTLLTQAFLRLLVTVEQPEALLALTFSRKAAAEMRHRILHALAAAAGEPPSAPDQRLTWELAASVRARDAALGWNLLASPSRLQVMTLDALALKLVARMPWLSRFGAPPRVADDSRALYRAAAQATLARIEASGNAANAAHHLLRHLNADFDAALALLAEMLEKRDQWAGWLARPGTPRADLRAALQAEIAAAVRRELEPVAARLATEGLAGLPDCADINAWRALSKAAVTTAGTQRKAWKQAVLSPAACAALFPVRDLPDAAFPNPQWALLEALFDLLPVALAELRLAFGARGECDFTEITLAACAALGSSAAPTPLAYALDGDLRHIFVDEFQDTSRAQFDLLQALVANWTPGDGRSAFLVGDPMQSIYTWRNAQVGLFLQTAARRRFGPVPLRCLDLGANYRSEAGLVDWCNATFGHPGVSLPADDAILGATRLLPAVAVRPGETSATVHALPGALRTFEAARVADLVQAELARAADKADIAILAQSRGHLQAILPELARRGIAFQGVKLLPLAESPVIADLLALVRALSHPGDRVAWLALLRAPWCGLTLADLLSLSGDQPHAAIPDLLGDADRIARLSPDGQRRLRPVAAVLTAAARQVGATPLAPLVEWCWQALDGDRLAPAPNRGDAEAFFPLLRQLDLSGFDLAALEQAVAQLYSPPDPAADGRVKVMTVHNAKGLEFDFVILPGLGRELQADRPPLLRWMDWPDPTPGAGDDDQRGLLAPRPETGGEDLLCKFVGLLQQRRRDQEQLRLLYVAATRARHRLHLFAQFPVNRDRELAAPKARSPLARIWPALQPEFQRQWQVLSENDIELLGTSAASAAMSEAPLPLRRAPADWSPPVRLDAIPLPPPGAAAPAPRFVADLERAIGTAVHALLQAMAESGERAWNPDHLRARLRQAGVAASGLDAALRRAARALDQTLADARGRWILDGGADPRSEWALSGLLGEGLEHRVVDRSFLDDHGQRWIIDYKTAAPPPGTSLEAFLDRQEQTHRPQLEAYARLIQTLDPAHPTRCALYYPQIPAWRELTPNLG